MHSSVLPAWRGAWKARSLSALESSPDGQGWTGLPSVLCNRKGEPELPERGPWGQVDAEEWEGEALRA